MANVDLSHQLFAAEIFGEVARGVAIGFIVPLIGVGITLILLARSLPISSRAITVLLGFGLTPSLLITFLLGSLAVFLGSADDPLLWGLVAAIAITPKFSRSVILASAALPNGIQEAATGLGIGCTRFLAKILLPALSTNLTSMACVFLAGALVEGWLISSFWSSIIKHQLTGLLWVIGTVSILTFMGAFLSKPVSKHSRSLRSSHFD